MHYQSNTSQLGMERDSQPSLQNQLKMDAVFQSMNISHFLPRFIFTK